MKLYDTKQNKFIIERKSDDRGLDTNTYMYMYRIVYDSDYYFHRYNCNGWKVFLISFRLTLFMN